ncbi:MAG TPA: hypothetical protein VJL32_00520 [Candidatus Paceibacterota bacterium]
MKKTQILLDVSLTGGRGPAKKAYEVISDLKERGISYGIVTDRIFRYKLQDMGITPDFVVDTDLTEKPQTVIEKFNATLSNINYHFLVKMGARVAGPIAARKAQKPYLLVDGGLPDCLTEEEGLYERKTFEQAQKVLITSQFPWVPPNRTGLKNIEVCGFPLSRKTLGALDKLRNTKKLDILKSISNRLSGRLPNREDDFLINLLMTGDYLCPRNRVTYGGWLTANQYDQCVGFVRRFVVDMCEALSDKDVFMFVDREIIGIVGDIAVRYPGLNLITFAKDWDYPAEIAMQAAADLVVSRATNYQPYLAVLRKKCTVTTPVPADGYMDEDSAAVQYQARGLTRFIPYDQENYATEIVDFLSDKERQEVVSKNLEDNVEFIKERNLNEILADICQNIR